MTTRAIVLLLSVAGWGCASTGASVSAVRYPPSRSEPVVDPLHGEAVPDPFRWLEDERSPEVKAWMRAQDGLARERLRQLPGRDALVRRFRELLYADSTGVPVKRGGRLFYQRLRADQEKAALCWREGLAGEEHVLLDPNGWSADGSISLGNWVPSWDGKRVVFQQKPNAADEATLHVVSVDTGEWSKVDILPGAKYASPHWTPDNAGFYYELLPQDPTIGVAERPGYTEVRFHRLGSDPAKDALVFPRTGDPGAFLDVWLSRDGKLLVVTVSHGWSEDDVYLQRLGKDAGFVPIVKGKGKGAKYQTFAWKDALYVLTDEGAPHARVFKASVDRPERKDWTEIVPEDPSASIEGSSLVGGQLVLRYLRNASTELRAVGLDGKAPRTLALPQIGTATDISGLEDDDEVFFAFSSFLEPKQVYRVTLHDGAASVWARVQLPIDPAPYTVSQVWYPSKDGTRISMFLVHRKDLVKDGSAPVLLHGYGGFGSSLTPSFNALVYPWLEAGGIYAVANLRGGSEYGTAWHEAGRLHRKQAVFDDFIAAAEFLIAQRYTRPERLAISGGSNGGLLVGAAMVQRPELFGAVLCSVPLLDMLRYHLFGSGRTWIPEYGTAESPEDFKVLRAYSPYHAVRAGVRYPALLVLSADHDDRVDPMHARKFIAAVQRANPGGSPAYLRIETNAGHTGADQVHKVVEARADSLAFLFDALRVTAGSAAKPASGRGTIGG